MPGSRLSSAWKELLCVRRAVPSRRGVHPGRYPQQSPPGRRQPGPRGGAFAACLCAQDFVFAPRSLLAVAGVLAAAIGFTGCGGGSGSAGPVKLNWFVATQPGGTIQNVAKRCSAESNGEYEIEFEFLPADADGQREQLVRRLAAEDSTDRPDRHGRDLDRRVRQRRLDRAVARTTRKAGRPRTSSRASLKTATFEGKLYAAPLSTNTQLLWYRKDLVPEAAEDLGRDDRRGARSSGPRQAARSRCRPTSTRASRSGSTR